MWWWHGLKRHLVQDIGLEKHFQMFGICHTKNIDYVSKKIKKFMFGWLGPCCGKPVFLLLKGATIDRGKTLCIGCAHEKLAKAFFFASAKQILLLLLHVVSFWYSRCCQLGAWLEPDCEHLWAASLQIQWLFPQLEDWCWRTAHLSATYITVLQCRVSQFTGACSCGRRTRPTKPWKSEYLTWPTISQDSLSC